MEPPLGYESPGRDAPPIGADDAGPPGADGATHPLDDDEMALVGHELRAPLGGIIGLAAMLLDTPLDSSQRATVHTIRTAAEHLAAVVERFAPHRHGSSRNSTTLTPFDPAVLATTVARLLEPQAAAKGLTLGVVGHRNLPTLVTGDPVALRQVLVNLVTNAIRATDHGSITVRVRPEHSADVLRFEVSDTGSGPTPAFIAAIEGEPGSAGFGLRISRELIDHMGGTLHATGNTSGGTTVWCAVACQPVTSTTAGDEPRRHIARVLVAQDDEVNAQVAVALLDRVNYAVDVVASGTDALRAWGTRRYDLLLIDQHLPDLDGPQVARCVRELERAEGRHVTIIGLTAGNQPVDRERCLGAGMDATLAKPLDLGALMAMLGRFAPAPPANETPLTLPVLLPPR